MEETMAPNKNDENASAAREAKPVPTSDVVIDENPPPKKKITIEVYEDDPCLKAEEDRDQPKPHCIPGLDPRFQQQNQTLRCWVMYSDFYRCEHLLGEGADACTWFKHVFTSICPNSWIEKWDDLREQGKFVWHKYKTQGDFPGDKYGV